MDSAGDNKLAWGFAAIGMVVAASISAVSMAFYDVGVGLMAIPVGGCFGYAIGAGYARWKATRSRT